MINVIRLQDGTTIIGKTEKNEDVTEIEEPYQLIYDGQGVQMMPFDAHLIGREIDKMFIREYVYKVHAGDEVKAAYLRAVSDLPAIIEETPKTIIT